MDRPRGCSIYDKRATLVNNIPASDKNILRSNTIYNIVLGKNTPKRNKKFILSTRYRKFHLYNNTPTRNNRNGGSRRANAPLATSESAP